MGLGWYARTPNGRDNGNKCAFTYPSLAFVFFKYILLAARDTMSQALCIGADVADLWYEFPH